MAEPGAIRQATTRDFLSVVFRQLWVIVTVFMIAVVSVVVVTLKTPTIYESESKVLVRRGQRQSVLNPNLQVYSWDEEVSSEIETVKSLPVTRRAQSILDAWAAKGRIAHPIKMAPSGVDAGVVEKSNVIKISYTHKDANTCIPVTQAVTEAYMEFRRESGTVPFVYDFFTREISAADSAMAGLLRRRQDYVRTNSTISPANEQQGLFQLLTSAESELMDAETQVGVLNQTISAARHVLESSEVPDPALFLSQDLGNQPNLTQLKDRWNLLRQERDALAARQTPEHPELKGVIMSLAEVEQQIRAEGMVTVRMLEARRNLLTGKAHSLKAAADGYRSQLSGIPHREITLSEFDREMQTLRERYKELVGKEIQARISQATSPDWTVTLFQEASRPRALRTTDYVRLALAPILSLVVGLMLAFFLDSLDHSLKSGSDVEEFLGIPVLASLPDARN